MTTYDCFLYANEIGALKRRLADLHDHVDAFVIVEVLDSAAGRQQSGVRAIWHELKPWASKLRHVVVTQKPATDPRDQLKRRIRALRPDPLRGLNAIGRALADLEPGDSVLLSRVTDIPSPRWVSNFSEATATESQVFAVEPDFAGAGESPGPVVGGVGVKVARENLTRPSRLLAAAMKTRIGAPEPRLIGIRMPPASTTVPLPLPNDSFDRRPVVICAYLHDEDETTVRLAFGLDDEAGKDLPFHLWQDTKMIGPERAFEYCWSQFPDRDVIIIHPDMWPVPGDDRNAWYEQLCAYADQLPDAGVVACDLIFPAPTASGETAAQCVGGRIKREEIKHVGGRNHPYNERYSAVRQVDWATFGGVLIRREAIDMVGSFDARYQWAYVMDVDYCMEIQRRGLRIYQVPVNIVHDQNGTTKEFLQNPEYKAKVLENESEFSAKWRSLFRGTPRDGADRPGFGILQRFPGA